jgi:hypothetical protein
MVKEKLLDDIYELPILEYRPRGIFKFVAYYGIYSMMIPRKKHILNCTIVKHKTTILAVLEKNTNSESGRGKKVFLPTLMLIRHHMSA